MTRTLPRTVSATGQGVAWIDARNRPIAPVGNWAAVALCVSVRTAVVAMQPRGHVSLKLARRVLAVLDMYIERDDTARRLAAACRREVAAIERAQGNSAGASGTRCNHTAALKNTGPR